MKEWLDGPRFIAWLEDEFNFDRHGNGPIVERRAHGLSRGEALSVWSADRLLTTIGLHISLIPDDLWVEKKPRRKQKKRGPSPSQTMKKEIIQRHKAGEHPAVLAQAAGVTERTVNRWTQESKRRAVR